MIDILIYFCQGLQQIPYYLFVSICNESVVFWMQLSFF